MARITSPVYSILSPPRGESEMSQLVSVTLLHQESTAPVKNGGLLLNSPFLLVPLFFTSKRFLFTVGTPQGNIYCE